MDAFAGTGLERITFARARSGDFTAYIDGRSLLSAYDPRREAERLAASLPPGPVTLVGLGLGHLAMALAPRLTRILCLPGERNRFLEHMSRPEDAQLLSLAECHETIRNLERAVYRAVSHGDVLALDPTLEAAPAYADRIRELVHQLTTQPRAVFIHLKTAGDILRTLRAVQSWKASQVSAHVTLVVEEPYGELASLGAGLDRVIEIPRGTDTSPPGCERPILAVNFSNEIQPARILAAVDPLFAAGFALNPENPGSTVLIDERSPERARELTAFRNRMNRWNFYCLLLGISPSSEPPHLSVMPSVRGKMRVVQFGAGSGAAVWAPKRTDPFELAGALEKIGGHWIAIGGADEAPIARAVGIPENDNYCGKTTWRRLAELLAESELYIGHDSGPTHLAAALGTPTLALFGFTSPILNAPFGSATLLLQADMPCAFGGCPVPCPEVTCTRLLSAESIAVAARHLAAWRGRETVEILRTAAEIRARGLRIFYPDTSVDERDPLRTLLESEPRLGPPRDPALALVREWLESAAR